MDSSEKLAMNISPGAASNTGDEPSRVEPADHAVVAQCQRGELQAYEILVTRYRQRVYGLAYGMLRNEQDARDVAQETFVRAWLAIKKFKRDSSFYTWIYRITTNLCIDFVRKRERQATTPFAEEIDPDTAASVAAPPSANPLPVRELERKELREQIDAALRELSPAHRAVIQLREFEGLDYAEIARLVGCSIGTVMSRLHYARKHLQKLLSEEQP